MRASETVSADLPVRPAEAGAVADRRAVARQRFLPLLGVLALTVLPYLNVQNAFWVGDDYNYVVPKTFDTVLNFFNPLGRAVYRPWNWATWAADYAVFGTWPPGWHLTSLALHLFNTLMVVLLLRELARAWWPADATVQRWVPLLAGALYGLHPAATETVSWTGGRADDAFAGGLFLAAWALARWRNGGRRQPGFYLLAVAGTWLSMLGKETGLITPLALLLVDWAIPEEQTTPAPFPAGEGGELLPSPYRGGVGGEVARTLLGALANGLGRVAIYVAVLVLPLIWLNRDGISQDPAAVFWARMTAVPLLLIGLRWPRGPARVLPGALGCLATLARDQAPFFAMTGAGVALRLGLYATGLGRLAYGTDTHLRFSLLTLLDSASGYLLIGLGAWEAPQEVSTLPVVLKVALVLVALGVAAGALRWLGRPAAFALLWIPATVIVTFDAPADRWFYVPALGVCLLAALAIYRVGRARPALRWALSAGLVLLWGAVIVEANSRWVESGEVARDILAQIRALHPDPPRPATFYMANPPFLHRGVLLFNSGFADAPSYAYQDYTTIRGYELQEHAAQVQAALADPAQLGPHPIFLRYEHGRLVEYPTLAALVAAQGRAGGP